MMVSEEIVELDRVIYMLVMERDLWVLTVYDIVVWERSLLCTWKTEFGISTDDSALRWLFLFVGFVSRIRSSTI